jgi:hypothetical protein
MSNLASRGAGACHTIVTLKAETALAFVGRNPPFVERPPHRAKS